MVDHSDDWRQLPDENKTAIDALESRIIDLENEIYELRQNKPTYEQLEAENARLRAAINERARTIIVLAEEVQGEWQDVSELYAPEWTEGYRAIIEHAQILLNQLDGNK